MSQRSPAFYKLNRETAHQASFISTLECGSDSFLSLQHIVWRALNCRCTSHSFLLSFSFYRYHCHTCKMVDGVGVCTVCAKVCHKDHEISYAKYGSFFCDCGAKEDGSCQVRPNTSGHHGKRTTAVTLACKSFPHWLPSSHFIRSGS